MCLWPADTAQEPGEPPKSLVSLTIAVIIIIIIMVICSATGNQADTQIDMQTDRQADWWGMQFKTSHVHTCTRTLEIKHTNRQADR